MLDKILQRLKSPVVLIELVTLVAGFIVALDPDISGTVKIISEFVVAVIALFAGINNPTDRSGF